MNTITIERAIQACLAVLLWGGPGTGKTSVVRSICAEMNLACEAVIAAIRDPSDFAGLPHITPTGVDMVPPAWARRLAGRGEGVLFLDEISCAPPAVQAALLRVVLERVVGDLPLPEGVRIIAAANPADQAAGGWDLAPPLANRFLHLEWTTTAQEWADGMVGGWPAPELHPLPKGWRDRIPAARGIVASFCRARPSLLSALPRDEASRGRAWPSPRTWDMAATCLAACEAAGDPEGVLAEMVAGCVSSPAALEFLTWRRELDLPDPEEVLAHPESFSLPPRGDRAYAVLTSVVQAAVGKLTPARWRAAWRVLAMAAAAGQTDIGAAAARLLASRRGNLPLPVDDVRAFSPLLRAAGMMGGRS